jgi:hypothetical protein
MSVYGDNVLTPLSTVERRYDVAMFSTLVARRPRWFFIWLTSLFSCLAPMARAAAPNPAEHPRVYGADDRQEYFDVADPRARAVMSESMVALVAKPLLSGTNGPFDARTPTWGAIDNLCPEEPFREQPSAAFCTGILVDWDLVLTAGHCLRVFAIDDISVVFNYYYEAPGQIATRREEAIDVVAIVAEALDGPGVVPRRDFGWIRLAHYAVARQPASVYVGSPALKIGDSIISIGTGGGVPMKFDAGGRVRTLREGTGDYFIADVDSSRGSSGAGAFTPEFALLGLLSRGGLDFVERGDGCQITSRVREDLAAEQFTYAHQAVTALCSKDPAASSLCRLDCGDICRANERSSEFSGGSCSVPGNIAGAGGFIRLELAASLVVVFAVWRQRRKSKNL